MNWNRRLKPIADFPDYSVDIYGRVFNRYGKELTQVVNHSGYCMVKLCRNGYEKNCPVHRLVADAFFDGDHDGYEVNHIDGNKQNNFIGNLEWVTRSENLEHAYRTNLRRCYLTDDDRKRGAQIYAERNRRSVMVLETGQVFNSLRECANALGLAASAISRCCHDDTRQYHGYHFAFVD